MVKKMLCNFIDAFDNYQKLRWNVRNSNKKHFKEPNITQ